jgi:hypothetical protein
MKTIVPAGNGRGNAVVIVVFVVMGIAAAVVHRTRLHAMVNAPQFVKWRTGLNKSEETVV